MVLILLWGINSIFKLKLFFNNMIGKRIFLKYKSIESGITLIEIIVVFSILTLLISIIIPSMKGFIYKNERDNYILRINSFLEVIKRETRRYGITCTLKTINIDSYPNSLEDPLGSVSPFELTCLGDNNMLSTLRFKTPKISKKLFQKVSGDLIFTPKGQVFIDNKNNSNNSFVLVVGMNDSFLGTNDSMRCIIVNQPSGLIINGSYDLVDNTSRSYQVSKYDNSLVDNYCAKD